MEPGQGHTLHLEGVRPLALQSHVDMQCTTAVLQTSFRFALQPSLASARVERAHSMFQLRFPTGPVHDTHMYPQRCGASGKPHIGPCTKHMTDCALMQGLSNQQRLAGAMAHLNLGCPGDAVRPVGLSKLAHQTQPRLSSTTRGAACKQVHACMRRQVHVRHAMLSKLHHKHSSSRHNTSCTAGESVCGRVYACVSVAAAFETFARSGASGRTEASGFTIDSSC
jgi:hypothetical protein